MLIVCFYKLWSFISFLITIVLMTNICLEGKNIQNFIIYFLGYINYYLLMNTKRVHWGKFSLRFCHYLTIGVSVRSRLAAELSPSPRAVLFHTNAVWTTHVLQNFLLSTWRNKKIQGKLILYIFNPGYTSIILFQHVINIRVINEMFD